MQTRSPSVRPPDFQASSDPGSIFSITAFSLSASRTSRVDTSHVPIHIGEADPVMEQSSKRGHKSPSIISYRDGGSGINVRRVAFNCFMQNQHGRATHTVIREYLCAAWDGLISSSFQPDLRNAFLLFKSMYSVSCIECIGGSSNVCCIITRLQAAKVSIKYSPCCRYLAAFMLKTN